MANFIELKLIVLTSCILSVNAMNRLWVDVVREVENCSVKSKPGDILHMEYIGKLEDGNVFDDSISKNQYYVFELGAGSVIKGWDEGLLDMCEGEQRYLIIPPAYGYGAKGAAGGVIPGDATLYMKVMLMKLESKGHKEL